MTTAVLRIAKASVGPSAGIERPHRGALEQSSGPFPRKLVHLCRWSSVTVSPAAPRRSPRSCRWRSVRHARPRDRLSSFTSARLLLPALSGILS